MALWYCGSVEYTAVTAWAATTAYIIGDIRRQLAAPAVGSERVFRCTTAGTSGGSEPVWVLTKAGTTIDNTAVWTEVTGNSTYNWTAPHARLANTFLWGAAGDDFYVSEDHAETQAAVMSLTFPGTPASPNRVLCVNHAGSVPPVSADLRTTATISTSVNNHLNFVSGCGYIYGITFTAGSGANNANVVVGSVNSISYEFIFDKCILALGASNVANIIQFGGSLVAVNTFAANIRLISTQLSFANVLHTIKLCSVRFHWKYTSSAVLGTLPTILFTTFAREQHEHCYLTGVDLSALGSGKSLISVAGTGIFAFLFQDCKLGASVSITTGAIPGSGGCEVTLVNCDSANTSYRYFKQTYQGTITHESTIVRTGGASDGTTTISRKMVSTANSKLYSPLESDPIVFWNESLSLVTVNVPVITDNVTLTNGDAWIEVEELGTSGFPLSVLQTCRSANVLATTSNQPTDGVSTWTTTGFTTPVKQSLTVTFTPLGKGPVKCRVMLARASTTIYFDPLIN